MARYRNGLPQLAGDLFLTDGGLETTLFFAHGIDLPEFAAFVVLDRQNGIDLLKDYYQSNAAIARRHGAGFILESPTWRASRARGKRIGIDPAKTLDYKRQGIALMQEPRSEPDAGDPEELGRLYGKLKDRLPRLNVVGGCCGTDHTHVARKCERV
jgi:homocysteine S-methyltransferase